MLSPPNMRLKLPGGDRTDRVHHHCARGRVARSLSVIR